MPRKKSKNRSSQAQQKQNVATAQKKAAGADNSGVNEMGNIEEDKLSQKEGEPSNNACSKSEIESRKDLKVETDKTGKDAIGVNESLKDDDLEDFSALSVSSSGTFANAENQNAEKSRESKLDSAEKFDNVSKNVKNQSNSSSKSKSGPGSSSVAKEKESSLDLSLNEKRKLYKCGKNFVTLEAIKKWPDYYAEKFKSLQNLKPTEVKIKKYADGYQSVTVDEALSGKISLYQGDMTRLEVEAIVNAANSSLLGGGGIDGAIHSAAGSALVAECRTLDGCPTGMAKTTAGYKLPARYVIHTVGPMDGSEEMLRSCYRSCFDEMQKHNIKSIAFCCISTGIYGYPPGEAVHIALQETRSHLRNLKKLDKLDSVERVVFCLFGESDVKHYETWSQVYFPVGTPEVSSDLLGESSEPPRDSSAQSARSFNTPTSKSPSTPTSKSPSTPTSKSPSTPTSKSPSTPTSKSPSTPSSKLLSSPSSESPITPSSESPNTPSSKSPSTPSSKSPNSPTSKSPITPTSESPNTPTSKSPTTALQNSSEFPATESFKPPMLLSEISSPSETNELAAV